MSNAGVSWRWDFVVFRLCNQNPTLSQRHIDVNQFHFQPKCNVCPTSTWCYIDVWCLLGRVRIWRKEHESMDPSCLLSMVQGGGVMVWGIFSWHTLGPLVPIEHRLNATAYLSIVADHVHPFMTTVYPSSSRIMHRVTKLKSSQTGFLNMTMSSLYSNGVHSHQISIQ